jgi:serine protease inhibitor
MRNRSGLPQWAAAAGSLVLLAVTSFAGDGAQAESRAVSRTQPKQSTDAMKSAANRVNALGARLLAQTVKQQAAANTIVSPLSLALALQMTANGSAGQTEQAFRQGLGLGGIAMEKASQDLGKLSRQMLARDKDQALAIANGIFLAPDAKPVEAYVASQSKTFQARIESRDFSQPDTLKAINAWFSEQTQGLIPQMLADLSPETRVVLANALYFKGRWQVPFQAEQTVARPFRVAGTQPSDVRMMHRSGRSFMYRETDAYQAVRLPFTGGAVEMVIALPREGLEAAGWATGLNAQAWADLLDNSKYADRPGELALPRLKLSSGGDVRQQLQAIGFGNAFGDKADFSRLARSPVRLDQVVHRTALKWDEEGAEAAAATAVVGVRSAVILGPQPFKMIVERPFVLVLRHVQTGTIVLLGLVQDPRESVS